METVLVTGGNGHLGYNLIKQLTAKGFKVRTTIRNMKDESKTKHLKNLQNLEIVEAELLDKNSLIKAMNGISGVFHTAAPVLMWSQNPYQDIVLPILKGTENVFEAAKQLSIQKIIYTSSCSACGMNSTPSRPIVESDWNSESISPLLRAKINAEKWAWEFSLKNKIKLITIHPPTVIGPNFFRHTPSTLLYQKILLGKLFPIPEGGCHLVDVRDVALAHLNAFTSNTAEGRYIIAGQYFKFSEFFHFLKKLNLNLKVPNFQLPMWSMHGFQFIDWTLNKFTGKPREITGEIIHDFLNKFQIVSTQKAQRDLNWKPIPTEKTILDTFNWINDYHLNRK